MNILFVVPYVPNPIRVRPYELVRTLQKRGHAVTVATLYQSTEERADLVRLQELGVDIVAHALPRPRSLWNSALAVPSRSPLQASYCWQPKLAQALSRLLQERTFDVVHVEHLRGARYGLFLRNQRQRLSRTNLSGTDTTMPIVWDSVDCISHLFAQAAAQSRSLGGRLMTGFELPRTRRYERWLLGQFDHVLVTSAADQRAFVALANEGQRKGAAHAVQAPTVLPNGVDLATECLNASSPLTGSSVAYRNGRPKNGAWVHWEVGTDALHSNGTQLSAANHLSQPTVVFSGKMSYHANVSAALYLVEEIMPHVWARHPEVKVQIVGKDPPSQIRALATAAPSGSSSDLRQVEVTGTVPEMRPYLQRATIAAAPLLYGAGIQNKILEAMACGTPVITTGLAANGIQARAGVEFMVADDAPAFAAAIVDLLADPTKRSAIGAAGRAYVEQHHSWDAIVGQLEIIYQSKV